MHPLFDFSGLFRDDNGIANGFQSFVTGSCAYGTPDKKSDIDLVVFISKSDLEKLVCFENENKYKELLEENENENDHYGLNPFETATLRFGGLNLILVTKVKDFVIWRDGTAELVALKPVTREVAVNHFALKRLATV